jgi:pimeloyl-ACP methyl ester carboxylesterase
MSLAHRLADLLPGARVAPVPDSATFIPEDQPAALTKAIREFLAERVPARA